MESDIRRIEMRLRHLRNSFLTGLLALAVAGGFLGAQTPAGTQPQADVLKRVVTKRSGAFFTQALPARGPGQNFEFVSAGFEFAGETIKDAPYSADTVTKTVQTLADGNRIVHENSTKIYRDSQGRTRREQSLGAIGPWAAAGEPHQMIFINDPVENVHYVLNPQEKTARKMTPPSMEPFDVKIGGEHPNAAAGAVSFSWIASEATAAHVERDVTIAAPGSPGIQVMPFQKEIAPPASESLGTRLIEGVQAEGTRTTMTIRAGQIGNERPIEIVSERWYSPELKTDVITKRNDPRFGETSYQLNNIQRIEPLPSLFQPPPDYTVEEGPALFKGPDHLIKKLETGPGKDPAK
jgi:hypothetical protein